MTLILRSMKKHLGSEDAKDDYVILDEETSVGRIHKDTTSPRWIWSVNTSPYIPHRLRATVSPSPWKRRNSSSTFDMKR
jgi:hypothetical protein